VSDDFDFSTGLPSEEMAQYLQLYLDESAEQLDALVESLLVLESQPANAEQLNEAFRLIHSLKGSSGMMGIDAVTALAHHLENHFERLRSGLRQLDERSMGLILRCIDFLRECFGRLRAGEALTSAPELLEELNALAIASLPAAPSVDAELAPASPPAEATVEATDAVLARAAASAPAPSSSKERDYLLIARFERELPLADLKAELMLTRLSEIAEVNDVRPARAALGSIPEISQVQVLLASDRSAMELRIAADVDGVERIEIEEGAKTFAPGESPAVEVHEMAEQAGGAPEESPATAAAAAPSGEAGEGRSKVVETVRVDIARLDNLMNLTGELVVNKARFVQIARQMSPAFKKSGILGRARAFGDSMRRAVETMKSRGANGEAVEADGWNEQVLEVESEIEALEEQALLWEESRRSFSQFSEAMDQMSRVSESLQRGVLQTRMVPVAPLFNRFKRVVRDISLELGKKVQLEIRGEKTELDKRMIDELGDPLVHLVRNAIDHGIETAETRALAGKPEAGVIRLEALHSGNNVLISIRDDGGGINVEKIRRRIVERQLAPALVAEEMPERDVIDHIWHPGFSTADVVSDISGRGVGMDIVKTRIAELNGAIDVEHEFGRGTTFTIRLPLTLAIVRSLLFRLRHGVFAVPIANVREIVSVAVDEIVTIRGRRTFEVRREFIPLVDIDDIFQWHKTPYFYPGAREFAEDGGARRVNVVILHAAEKTMGLKVSELQGSQDIVIKSLAENFVHIRGLSGASILGNGSVCLLLDVSAAIAMAAQRAGKAAKVDL
jgi:two-component system chemotaxis sensor kinase CheA